MKISFYDFLNRKQATINNFIIVMSEEQVISPMGLDIHKYTCVYMCIHTHAQTHTHKRTHTNAHTHAHAHAHTHTYIYL